MSPLFVPLVLLLGSEHQPLLPNVDEENACKICHSRTAQERGTATGVHEDVTCVECHSDKAFNPHAPAQGVDEEAVATYSKYAEHGAVAYAACGDCHEDEVAAWRSSIHGPDGQKNADAKHPACAACHGSIHRVTEASQTKLALAERCASCHAFAEAGKQPTSPYVVDTYRETVHGKMLHLGNDEAAACTDCHGSHAIYAGIDPRSRVHQSNRAKTCAKCHLNASASFADAISHRPHHINTDFWGGVTAMLFSLLTLSVIFLLLVHVVLDFWRAGKNALAGDAHPATSASGPVAADEQVTRFDSHMRLQHIGMLTSFTTLVITGWPLKAAHVQPSSGLVRLFGGQGGLAIVHRTAGAVLIVVALYHLIYLAWRWKRGELSWQMLPGLKDARDLLGNVAYFLGLRKERPSFGRWTYYEKFDYWAVFWGMVIMGGSGLILWFPVAAAKLLPGKLLDIAFIAHSDEALLALLAIFLWHFYNVHLRPTVFPMSWVWLTGKLSAEALYTEHRAEYVRVYGTDAPPKPATVGPTWHQKPWWSYIAVLLIVAAAALVLRSNLGTLRSELLMKPARPPATTVAVTRDGPRDVYDQDFHVFDTCFACHNERHANSAKSGFPHQAHFEEQGVEKDCASCHKAHWHKSMEVTTEPCLECHDAAEIGLQSKDL